jgi:2,4-dienoyl-CoA reductase-like NADH-dependent reductase (Old Yellow Enzyme family)
MTLNQATESGHITPWIEAWYRRRAEGGVGAVIGAAAFVAGNGRAWPNAMGIADESYVPGWRRCVDVVHAAGGLFGTQLVHGGAASRVSLLGHQPLSASNWTRDGFDPARAMTGAEVEQAVLDFAAAARYSMSAGCDFVELHGAHGYLLHQFWRRDVNRRTDRWGEPTAFPAAVVRAVRAAIGPEVPLLYRFSIHADDPAAPNHSVTLRGLAEFLRALEEAGVDVWDISCWHDSRRGYFGTPTWLSDHVREFSAKPRLVAGSLLTPEDASSYLAGGHAEAAVLARALIADAAWVVKTRRGEAASIQPWQDAYNPLLKTGVDPGASVQNW